MNNKEVKALLDDCQAELDNIAQLLTSLGEGARPTPYIRKYAVIRASGSIETAFKQIIADKVDKDSHVQVQNFIKRKIRDSSCNPKLGMIQTMVQEFDQRWAEKFNERTALANRVKLQNALKDLVDARNDFAHGGNPDMSIEDTIEHFKSGVTVIEILDEVVHFNYDQR